MAPKNKKIANLCNNIWAISLSCFHLQGKVRPKCFHLQGKVSANCFHLQGEVRPNCFHLQGKVRARSTSRNFIFAFLLT